MAHHKAPLRTFLALLAVIGTTVSPTLPALGQAGPVRLLGVAPLSPEGNEWRNGVELALREINARGGILGRPVLVAYSDALTGKPDFILSMTGPAEASAAVAQYVAETLKARTLAIAAPETEILAAFTARGMRVTQIVIEPQQIDFSAAVIRAKNARAEALVVALPVAETVSLLRELRRQGYDKPIIGDATLLGAAFLEQVGEAASGLRAVVGLEPAAPLPAIRDTARKYEHAYRVPASAQALRGYSALYAAKAVAARTGRVETGAMKGLRLEAAAEPGLLLDAVIDESGALNYRPLLVEIRDGRAVLIEVLPAGSG